MLKRVSRIYGWGCQFVYSVVRGWLEGDLFSLHLIKIWLIYSYSIGPPVWKSTRVSRDPKQCIWILTALSRSISVPGCSAIHSWPLARDGRAHRWTHLLTFNVHRSWWVGFCILAQSFDWLIDRSSRRANNPICPKARSQQPLKPLNSSHLLFRRYSFNPAILLCSRTDPYSRCC